MVKETCAEVYISVDVEASGPNPGRYSLLSIGACLVKDPERTFYVELQPTNGNATQEALDITGLSMAELAVGGVAPSEAMHRFAEWLEEVSQGKRLVFVAFNAPFDWMFVNDYFHRYLGYNPFGHSALDIKSFYMGLTGVCWADTSLRKAAQRYLGHRYLTHNALQDALDQAELFRAMLSDTESRREAG